MRGRDQAALEAIPQSVQIVKGDIGDYDACMKAMRGCDKVGHWRWHRTTEVRESNPQFIRLGTRRQMRRAGQTCTCIWRCMDFVSNTRRSLPSSPCYVPRAYPHYALQVISCVSARSDLTVDLKRVEEEGIKNLARAYMVSVAEC